jgi:4-carboxymuconolactone decarboxylase
MHARFTHAIAVMFCAAAPVLAHYRMPPIAADKLTEAQKKAIEEFRAARSADVTGPFVPLLRSPEVLGRARAMGDYLRYRSALPPRLSELVILMTARAWTQNYEWNAHEPLARRLA